MYVRNYDWISQHDITGCEKSKRARKSLIGQKNMRQELQGRHNRRTPQAQTETLFGQNILKNISSDVLIKCGGAVSWMVTVLT